MIKQIASISITRRRNGVEEECFSILFYAFLSSFLSTLFVFVVLLVPLCFASCMVMNCESL